MREIARVSNSKMKPPTSRNAKSNETIDKNARRTLLGIHYKAAAYTPRRPKTTPRLSQLTNVRHQLTVFMSLLLDILPVKEQCSRLHRVHPLDDLRFHFLLEETHHPVHNERTNHAYNLSRIFHSLMVKANRVYSSPNRPAYSCQPHCLNPLTLWQTVPNPNPILIKVTRPCN